MVEYQKVLSRVEQLRNNPGYLGELHERVSDLEEEERRMERGNKERSIRQWRRENELGKMGGDDGPKKNINKIKELQDKLATVQEGIKKETIASNKYEELVLNLENQETALKSAA